MNILTFLFAIIFYVLPVIQCDIKKCYTCSGNENKCGKNSPSLTTSCMCPKKEYSCYTQELLDKNGNRFYSARMCVGTNDTQCKNSISTKSGITIRTSCCAGSKEDACNKLDNLKQSAYVEPKKYLNELSINNSNLLSNKTKLKGKWLILFDEKRCDTVSKTFNTAIDDIHNSNKSGSINGSIKFGYIDCTGDNNDQGNNDCNMVEIFPAVKFYIGNQDFSSQLEDNTYRSIIKLARNYGYNVPNKNFSIEDTGKCERHYSPPDSPYKNSASSVSVKSATIASFLLILINLLKY